MTTINYRVVVNESSEIYRHIEFCGDDFEYAKSQFEAISKEIEDDDTIELQSEVNFSGFWNKIN